MAPKVGINGFGRIGRLVLRAAIAKGVEVSNSQWQGQIRLRIGYDIEFKSLLKFMYFNYR